jgi:Holliday junction resolvase
VTGATFERELQDLLEEAGNHVSRAAGSNGPDLTVITPRGATMIIEAKSFSGNVFSVRRKAHDLVQWQEMMNLAEKMKGTAVRYALRQKRPTTSDVWRLLSPNQLEKPYHWDSEIPPLRRGSTCTH